jgi:hypothetical protein
MPCLESSKSFVLCQEPASRGRRIFDNFAKSILRDAHHHIAALWNIVIAPV